MRKFKISIGEVREEGVIDCPDELIAVPESAYWRLGEGVIAGRLLNIERKTSLGDVEYRIGESILRNQDVECWNGTEWMDWRD